MKRIAKIAAVFFGVLAGCAALAWLAGFDFDRRGFDVAYGAFVSAVIAAIAAAFADDML